MASVDFTVKVSPPQGVALPAELAAQAEAAKLATFPLAAGQAPIDSPKPFEPHYTNLVGALEAAQASLNGVLTQWKDAIGDAEKSKDVVAKPGQGKAMLMVQGAREVDGRKNPATMFDGEDESEDDEEGA